HAERQLSCQQQPLTTRGRVVFGRVEQRIRLRVLLVVILLPDQLIVIRVPHAVVVVVISVVVAVVLVAVVLVVVVLGADRIAVTGVVAVHIVIDITVLDGAFVVLVGIVIEVVIGATGERRPRRGSRLCSGVERRGELAGRRPLGRYRLGGTGQCPFDRRLRRLVVVRGYRRDQSDIGLLHLL